MPNPYRRLLAEAIERNGGYSRYLDGSYALSWNVSVHESIEDFDKLLPEVLADNDYGLKPDTPLDSVLLKQMQQDWDDNETQDGLWQRLIENMSRSVMEDDTYRTLRPEIATRYGLPVSAFPKKYSRRTEKDQCFYPLKFGSKQVEGWVLENAWALPEYDVTWAFHGRMGKHLVLESFEGRDLKGRDLAAAILEDDSGLYSNTWCQNLLAFIDECDLCFTRKMVADEFNDQMRYEFGRELYDISEQTEAMLKEAAERLYWAERDIITTKRCAC